MAGNMYHISLNASSHSLILNLRKLILHGGLAIIKIHHNFVEYSAVVSFFYFNLNLPK